jgi:[ribosomal protein S18]-alanine N-acetyltransferase
MNASLAPKFPFACVELAAPTEVMLFEVKDISFRLARSRDAQDIAAMSLAFIEHGLRPAWSAARILRHVRHPESVVLVAERGRRIVGFAIMDFGDDTAHLNLLAVTPSERRRRLGERLVAWLEETALTAGTFIVELELRAGNPAARAFYESLNYAEVARISGYYQGVEDAVRMRRDVRIARTSTRSR